MLLLSNPVAGSGSGPAFIKQYVLPLLAGRSYQHVVTQAVGDAGIKAIDYVKSHSDPLIIVSGGDGTLHEVVNGLAQLEQVRDGSKSVEIVLLPLGTANALYSSLFPPSLHPDLDLTQPAYKLLSLQSYLKKRSDPNQDQLKGSKCLPIAIQSTTFLGPTGEEVSNILSIVVTSTSLHASILHTADQLRKDRPDLVGVERFKVAARQNITNWYYSSVELIPFLPSRSEGKQECLRYNPSIQQFEPWTSSQSSQPFLLGGPFEYFLSIVNVDRLEPDFRIAPLHSKLPSASGNQSYMDLVIVRPFRHPLLKGGQDDEEQRKGFVDTSMAVLQSAYKDGAHVDLRYKADGTPSASGDGEPIVEYFRCGGWEWIPKEDKLAELVCADGTIVFIPSGGKAVCRLLTGKEDGIKLSVWS